MNTASVETSGNHPPLDSQWQSPPDDICDVLHAQQFPLAWTSPTGEYMILGDRILYPALAELAAPMHKLAGTRVNPAINSHHGQHGGLSPRLVRVEDGTITPLPLPKEAELYAVRWTADGRTLALIVRQADHLGLWVGSVDGTVAKIEGIALNPLLGNAVRWLPDQRRLLVRRIPDRGPAPQPPVIPAGPSILEGIGASARSTYEARNLLETDHDDALFEYYMTSELVIVDPNASQSEPLKILGQPALYTTSQFSPDGEYLLMRYLVGPWSHEVGWWRFASETEVWTKQGDLVATIASLPVADAVPTHGVPTGPRSITWRPTAPHTLFWVEALDGGNPTADVPHRDRLMRLDAPFTDNPQVVFQAEHRIQPGKNAWSVGRGSTDSGLLMLTQRERIRRWRYVWLIDVDQGTSRLWFDLNESDRYGDPGRPVLRSLPNGRWVMHQQGNGVYFRGNGATEEGDRPFLDVRDLETGDTERLFHCGRDRYEAVVSIIGTPNDASTSPSTDHPVQAIVRSESKTDVPNYYLVDLSQGSPADAPPANHPPQYPLSKEGRSGPPPYEGGVRGGSSTEGRVPSPLIKQPITHFEDPTPQLRHIQKQIVRYEREDGVPLSFHLYIPPGYQSGTPLPTVLYAYPLEYSSKSTAGQVRGSEQRFMRIYGPSHLYFLLRGYAVLDQTAMPMIGDPETVYDTFVPQLVADAEAAVTKAVDMGVADPERVGIIGHSHGGLMVANLLAHTDLFKAGIARSGSYNKTNQPFGFQGERRSLFEARDVYINVSPTFLADKVKQPVLIIHGNDDSNPGTLTSQSQVFYEAVRGTGGTARLVLLPFEDHGYRAKESIEHVLWEQLRWFDQYV